MRLCRRAVEVAALLVSALLAVQGHAQTASAPGVYTAEQAAAGEKVYFEQCAACHGDDLGGREKAVALTGVPFAEAWNGKDLRRMLEGIETMPPTAGDPWWAYKLGEYWRYPDIIRRLREMSR